MSKQRLDQVLVIRNMVPSRSQAESWIKLGKVTVDGQKVTRPGTFIRSDAHIVLQAAAQYVSRAGLKLASVASKLGLQFKNAIVLDVGSSTGGFTDYALQQGAKKVIAVDVGTNQLHPSLRTDSRVELHEQTDIRAVQALSAMPVIVVVDVSFISVRDILPHIASVVGASADIVAMLKPQFESGGGQQHKGVIKNDTLRRKILHDFEVWAKRLFVIRAKADSDVTGAKGNRERFYVLRVRSAR